MPWAKICLQKKKKKKKKKGRAASSANTQPFSDFLSVRTRFILRAYVELWRFEMNNIIHVVKNEYNEYFKHIYYNKYECV